MKRLLLVVLLAACSIGVSWGAYQFATSATNVAPDSNAALSRFVPAGALLYLQANEFRSLLSDWNGSNEKNLWLKSSNYEVFSRSRLFLRLKDANAEFSKAAGVPADANLLGQIAGKETALAIYDIGKLEFLYISRQPPATAMQSSLWQTRSQFEPRDAAGTPFFVRHDPESGREVAFAVAGDCLLLATRQDLLADALQLIADRGANSVESEPWFVQSIAAANPVNPPSDLRMVLNLEKIVPSPYFRSYWVQQNVTQMRQYSAAVSDLNRAGNEFREDRVLVRRKPTGPDGSAFHTSANVADILRYVPARADVYEAKSSPTSADCLALLEAKILVPRSTAIMPDATAPQVQLDSGAVGDSTDFETRVDQPVLTGASAQDNASALKALFAKTPVTASLRVQSTTLDEAGVFVRVHSVIVFSAPSAWNEPEVRSALTTVAAPTLTTSLLGFDWEKSPTHLQLNGLWPLVTAFRGQYLFVSDDASLLKEVLAAANQKVPQDAAVFVAGFNHETEKSNFLHLTSLLDRPAGSPAPGASPAFFSENIGSLSGTFSALASERIVVRDLGDKINQTVTYQWAQ